MKFILVRHSTSIWNLENRAQGRIDIELHHTGREQTKQLTQQLLGLNISKIVSSDLKRASETAEIINQELNLPLFFEENLRECSFGKIQGLIPKEAEKYGKLALKAWAAYALDYDFTSFGGENWQQVLKRHLAILQKYSNTKNNEVILLVGHGRGLNTILAHLGKEPNLKRGQHIIIDFNK
jgi:probable phosphoglycerate mutase